MVKKRRACIFLSFIIGIVSIFLLGLSFGTNYWIISRPIRVVNTPNNSFIYENSKINFGLWRGEKTLDAGFSTEGRTNEIKVIPRYIDTRIFTYELWLSSIVLLIIAMIWAIISVFFALINSIIYPIDKMAGTMGLYLWNALSLAFTFLSTLLFTILYFGDIRQNVLVLEEKRSGFEADGNRTQFGWSYWSSNSPDQFALAYSSLSSVLSVRAPVNSSSFQSTPAKFCHKVVSSASSCSWNLLPQSLQFPFVPALSHLWSYRLLATRIPLKLANLTFPHFD
ncbi:unnamed protein product [Gordionus sp. m RMFG-2023]